MTNKKIVKNSRELSQLINKEIILHNELHDILNLNKVLNTIIKI